MTEPLQFQLPLPLPQPHYQIHRYPSTLIETRALAGSRLLTLRPVLPQDEELLAQLLRGLTPEARRYRFHGAVTLSAAHLQQMSSVDYQQQMALVVTAQVDGAEQLIADARYCVHPDGRSAEFALVVAERWQRLGVGAWAVRALQCAATTAGLEWLHGDVLRSNRPMLGLLQSRGFALTPDAEDDQMVNAQRRLGAPAVRLRPARHGLRSWLQQVWPDNAFAAIR